MVAGIYSPSAFIYVHVYMCLVHTCVCSCICVYLWECVVDVCVSVSTVAGIYNPSALKCVQMCVYMCVYVGTVAGIYNLSALTEKGEAEMRNLKRLARQLSCAPQQTNKKLRSLKYMGR